MKELEYKTDNKGKPLILLLPDEFFNLLKSDKEQLAAALGIRA